MTDLPLPQHNKLSLWQKLKGYMIVASAFSAFLAHYWDDIWKVLYGLAVGSIELWGDNNWYEQLTEAINKWITGVNVDISKEAAQYSGEPRDLKKYIPDER